MLRHHAIDQHRPASRPVRCRKGDTPPTACRAGGWPLWQHAPGRAKPEALSVREQSRLAVTEGECGGEGESEPRSATDVSTNRSSTYADQQIAAQFAGCDFVPTPKKNEADTACQPRPSLEQATGIRTTVCGWRPHKSLIHLRRPTNCCAICGARHVPIPKNRRARCALLFFGAGNGNRTRISSLGSWCSATELCLQTHNCYFTLFRAVCQSLFEKYLPRAPFLCDFFLILNHSVVRR